MQEQRTSSLTITEMLKTGTEVIDSVRILLYFVPSASQSASAVLRSNSCSYSLNVSFPAGLSCSVPRRSLCSYNTILLPLCTSTQINGGIILKSTKRSKVSLIASRLSTCPFQPNFRALSILKYIVSLHPSVHQGRHQAYFVAHDQDIVSESWREWNIPSGPSNGAISKLYCPFSSDHASRTSACFVHSGMLNVDLQRPFGPYLGDGRQTVITACSTFEFVSNSPSRPQRHLVDLIYAAVLFFGRTPLHAMPFGDLRPRS